MKEEPAAKPKAARKPKKEVKKEEEDEAEEEEDEEAKAKKKKPKKPAAKKVKKEEQEDEDEETGGSLPVNRNPENRCWLERHEAGDDIEVVCTCCRWTAKPKKRGRPKKEEKAGAAEDKGEDGEEGETPSKKKSKKKEAVCPENAELAECFREMGGNYFKVREGRQSECSRVVSIRGVSTSVQFESFGFATAVKCDLICWFV